LEFILTYITVPSLENYRAHLYPASIMLVSIWA